MKKIILLGVALLSLSKVALASSTSDIFLIESAIVEPKQSYFLKLDGLTQNVPYDVTCEKITSSVREDIDVYYSALGSMASLDGKSADPKIMQLKADHYASGYKLSFETITTTYTAQGISFTNLDDKAVVSLVRCVAKVHHNS